MKKLIAAPVVLWLAACTPSPPVPEATGSPVTEEGAEDTARTVPSASEAVAVVADDPSAVNQRIDDVLGDHARYEAVIRQLQQAVAAHDAQAVAALVHYPFATVRDGDAIRVEDAAGFVRAYDRIMTPAIVRAIADQRYAQLMVNYKGVMFGNGEAWVNGICKDDACKDVDVRVVALQPGS